jgi:hypothetical protein
MPRTDLYVNKGDRLSAGKHNRLVDLASRDTQGAGNFVDSTGSRSRNRSGIGGLPIRMRVKAVKKNFLECKEYDGENEGTETIKVAKPYTLRGSLTSYDGVTFSGYSTDGQSRTATIGATTESQVINPKWIVDCEIKAIGVIGGTGVVTNTSVTTGGNGRK